VAYKIVKFIMKHYANISLQIHIRCSTIRTRKLNIVSPYPQVDPVVLTYPPQFLLYG